MKCTTLTPLTISGKAYKAGQSIDLPEPRARRLQASRLVAIDGESPPKKQSLRPKPQAVVAESPTDAETVSLSSTEGPAPVPKTAAKPKVKAVAKPVTQARAKGGGKAKTE